MKIPPLFTASAIICLVVPSSLAQIPAAEPAVASNLVTNGGFERFFAQDNHWDGVDSEGNLAGSRVAVEALAESGSFRSMAMPVSVTAGDLNGDGLVDIFTADPNGYMRVYFNSGTKEAPAFTHAEAVPLYLSASPANRRKAPRVNLFDWSRRGVSDLIMGNYYGELFFIQNTGSASAPDFRQPAEVDKALVATTKAGGLWANLLAPVAYDFNKDGRVDVAIGEGSYSANAVHLLTNQGSNNSPKFDEENRFYLAYGDGREHLTPTVVDYNGDGQPDIVMSDREGKLGAYLNPGPNWKQGVEFKFSEYIKFGAAENLGGYVTIHGTDMNGDGLFDLLIGKSNGRLAMAVNVGTKTAPKFNAPVDIKGTDIWGRNILNPSGWQYDAGFERGNTFSAVTCVSEETEPKLAPPEGKMALKIGYFPSSNKIFKTPAFIINGDNNVQTLFSNNLEFDSTRMPSNSFMLRKSLPQLKVGGNYAFSFKSRGVGATGCSWTIGWEATQELAPSKVTATGDRGSVTKQQFTAREEKILKGAASATAGWSANAKAFNVDKLKDRNLQDVTKVNAVLEIRGTLTPNTGAFYIDDIVLEEK